MQTFSEKHWWKSKTLWFNTVTLVVVVSGASMQFTGQLGLTEVQAGWAGLTFTMANAVGNFVLRFLTSTAIK